MTSAVSRVCTFITYTYEATEVADAPLAPNFKRVPTSLPEGVDPTKPLRELPRLQFVPARPQLRLSQALLRCQPAPVGDGSCTRGGGRARLRVTIEFGFPNEFSLSVNGRNVSYNFYFRSLIIFHYRC